MKERVAVLDLGTNTFHLLIVDVEAGKSHVVIYATQRHPRLGEGGITVGIITKQAFKRALTALNEFSKLLADYKVEKVRALGTAAIRQAKNGLEFIQKVKEQTAINIEIIDGDREALLIYQGVKQAVPLNKTSLIMDIGGGSIEFILGDKNAIIWQKSYPIGVARLTAQFHHTDPISLTEVESIHHYLNEQLNELKVISGQYQPQVLIGSAGAFETFAALTDRQYAQGSTKSLAFSFDLGKFHQVAMQILCSSHHDRVNNPDILPVRVDMIVASTLLVQYILKELDIKQMMLSAYALKEGLLFEIG